MAFSMPATITLGPNVTVDVLQWEMSGDGTVLEFDIKLSLLSKWHEFEDGLDGIDKPDVLLQLGLEDIPMTPELHSYNAIEARVILTRT